MSANTKTCSCPFRPLYFASVSLIGSLSVTLSATDPVDTNTIHDNSSLAMPENSVVEALVLEESERQRQLARKGVKILHQTTAMFENGDFERALQTIDSALAEIDYTTLTKTVVDDLRQLRASAARKFAKQTASRDSPYPKMRDGPEGETQWEENEGIQGRPQAKQQLLSEVDLGWQRPRVFDREAAPDQEVASDGLREKLRRIALPQVDFNGVALSRVIDTISALSMEFDPEGLGVNIVLIDPSGADPEVRITLRRLTLNRILDFIVESVGFEYDVQNDAVVVRPGSGSGNRLETDFFPLSRSTMIRLTGFGMQNTAFNSASSDPFAPLAPTAGDPTLPTPEEEALKSFLQRAGIPFDQIPNADLALADGQLIVTNTPRNIEKVQNLLRRYNEIKQVEIESKFLEVQQSDLDELGVNWLVTGDNDTFSTSGRSLKDAFSVNPDSSRINISRGTSFEPITQTTSRQVINPVTGIVETLTDAITSNRAVQGKEISVPFEPPRIPGSLDLASDAGNLAVIRGGIGDFQIEAVIRALSRKEGSDLLSAPKVTVLSGKTAEIVVAQEFRYPESYGDIEANVSDDSLSLTGGGGSGSVAITTGTPRDFAVRNIGVEMEVTPSVEDDNSISLLLEPKVTEFEGFVEYGGPSIAIAGSTTVTVPSGFFQPIFSVRKIRTEVTIWDGATVVMGGLTREQVRTVDDKVPILGDIPLLGRLFRSKGESSQKRNLLIFVTANLISPGGSLANQKVQGIEPGSLFQNPTLTTPGGAIDRGL